MSLLPLQRPVMTVQLAGAVLGAMHVTESVALIGVRGFFGANERGEFDDAMFLKVGEKLLSFNANTDPSKFRSGHGVGASAGMATLKEGVYMYQLGMHKSQYLALIQAGRVTVYRDADSMVPPDIIIVKDGHRVYEETGFFGINIHHSGETHTASEGCQTIYEPQWEEFITEVRTGMASFKQTLIPYVLLEQSNKQVMA